MALTTFWLASLAAEGVGAPLYGILDEVSVIDPIILVNLLNTAGERG